LIKDIKKLAKLYACTHYLAIFNDMEKAVRKGKQKSVARTSRPQPRKPSMRKFYDGGSYSKASIRWLEHASKALKHTSTMLYAGSGVRDESREVRWTVMTRNGKHSSNTTDAGGMAAGGVLLTEPQKSCTAEQEKSCKQTEERMEALRAAGFLMIVKWECEDKAVLQHIKDYCTHTG